jgi:elongation factor P
MKANELKRGMVFLVDGKNIMIRKMHVQTICSRSGSTIYKVLGHDVVTRQKFEQGYKGDDQLTMVDISRQSVQPLFRDGDGWTFMDSETYEQYSLSDSMIEEELPYMSEGLEGISAIIADEVILGIELPPNVILTIEDCSPGLKGASSSARTKPATMNTGLVVQVPEFLAIGVNIKVNTETGEYISRA